MSKGRNKTAISLSRAALYLRAPLIAALFLAGCASPYDYDAGAYGDYAAGQYARSEGDAVRAGEYFERALRIEPDNLTILREAFSLALMTGRFDDTRRYAKAMYETSENRATAAMFLALDAFKRGRYEACLEYLQHARGSGLDSLVAPIIRAWSAAATGEADVALEHLAGLSQVPVFKPYSRDNRAYMMDYLGQYEQAELVYQQVLEDAANISVHPVLAYAAMMERNGRVDEAIDLLRAYRMRWPENRRIAVALEGLEAKGRSGVKQPTPVDAVGLSLLRAASEIAQDNAIAPATLYARLSTFVAPDRHDAFLLIGNLFAAQNEYEEALRALAHIDRGSLFSDLARIREAFVFNGMGETEKALSILNAYLDRNPDDLGTRTSLGDLYQVNEEWQLARAQYDEALRRIGEPGPAHWYQVFARAICYERLGEWDKAEADFMLAMQLRPDEAQILNYLGYSWIDRGMRIDEARGLIERAVDLRPNDGAIVDSLGWVLYHSGEYDEAVAHLERAVELVPTDPLVNDHLGDAYWMVGRKMEARFQWARALTLDPEERFRSIIEAKIELGLSVVQAQRDN